MSENSRLWAAYLELYLGDDDTRKRRQWVFAPPVPAELAPDGMRPTNCVTYWYRQQNAPDHRAAWTPTHVTNGTVSAELYRGIKEAEEKGWKARPMVTCEVHPLEMAQLQAGEWKTPYRLLNRLARVAQHKHNYKI